MEIVLGKGEGYAIDYNMMVGDLGEAIRYIKANR